MMKSILVVEDDFASRQYLLLLLKKLKFENVEEQFHELFTKQFHKLFPKAKKGKKYKATVIIDAHEQETYSKQKRTHEAIRGGKHKNGTNFFFKYLTMQVMIKNKIITLGVRFYSHEEHQRKLVDQLIQYAGEHVKIDLVLLDRGFRDAALLNNFEYRGASVLMPCVKDAKAEKCFDELREKKFKSTRFVISNNKKEAANVAEHALLLGVILSIFFTTVGIASAKPLFIFLGATKEMMPHVLNYAYIIFGGSLFMLLGFMANSILRGLGDMKTPMKVMIISTIINIILDPIFIFG